MQHQEEIPSHKPVFTPHDVSFHSALVESSGDAILTLSLDGKILTFNKAAETLFGYAREEITGKSAFELVAPFDTVRMKKNGSRFSVSLRISPIHVQGSLEGFSWIVRDTTQRDEKEDLLRKLSSVVKQTADTVMITDTAGTVEYVNPAFIALTGYSNEEVIGQSAKILKSGKHSRLFYKTLWTTILSGRPFRATMINRKKNGELFHTEKTITPLADPSGEISCFVSTDKDVTDRIQAEQHARALQRRFTELFNFAPDAMAYCALDGTFIEVNDALARFTGYAKEELVNRKKYQDISVGDEGDLGNTRLQHLLLTGEPCSYEIDYTKKDGGKVPAWVTAFPVKNEEGKTVGVGMIGKEVTQLKQQQAQLERAMAELTRSNSDLEAFASVASHDLQEPLRTLCTYLQLIERGNRAILEPESLEYLEYAVAGALRMHALTEDLLTYARLGTNRSPSAAFPSQDAVQEALCALTQAQASSGAQVEWAELPSINADRGQIVQLFQNLLSNAIKYRREIPPRICISARREQAGWTFQVADNGIGIENAARIFEMFTRLHARSEFPGTGIGLAICKKIVERRGGKIWVESELGQGSHFYFTVPDELPCI